MTQTRLKPLALEEMSPEQRAIAERRFGGSLGRLGAPMNVLIRSPNVAARVESLSDYLRIEPLAISNRSREMVILLVARFWTAQYPWSAHYPLALKQGLSPETLSQIAAGKRPAGLQPDEVIVYDFITSALEKKGVSDAVFAAVVKRYGERGVAELVALIGGYTTACLATIVDNCPPQEGAAPRLESLD